MPELFCLWSGILISWSAFIGYGLLRIMRGIKLKKLHSIRESDTTSFIITVFGGIFLSTAMFIFPEVTARYVDVMIALDIWFSIFLFCVTKTSLMRLPGLAAGDETCHPAALVRSHRVKQDHDAKE